MISPTQMGHFVSQYRPALVVVQRRQQRFRKQQNGTFADAEHQRHRPSTGNTDIGKDANTSRLCERGHFITQFTGSCGRVAQEPTKPANPQQHCGRHDKRAGKPDRNRAVSPCQPRLDEDGPKGASLVGHPWCECRLGVVLALSPRRPILPIAPPWV